MHTHAAEVVAETRLEIGADIRVELLTRLGQHLVDDRWCHGLPLAAGVGTLGLRPSVFLFLLHRLTLGTPSTAGANMLRARIRHAHHLLRDTVGFPFVDVRRGIHR